MRLFIYNTATRKKEAFVSLLPKKVKMYVCGPTVYGLLHVGNFRGPVFFHLVCRWLEEIGYQVSYVFNFTDIDDKIIDRAFESKTEASILSKKYIEAFKEDYQSLKLEFPTHTPKVSDYIQEIIQFISKLIDKGKAYIKEGNVYFDVPSYKNYGHLSGINIDDAMKGESIKEEELKNHPVDFALWKKSKSGEPFWDSPWGKGRPGWHIECSTMAYSILGESIDIHGGGMDLVFPHHENEKAQSEALTKKPFVRYWMHHNLLEWKHQKMSKSLGNIQTYRDFLKEYNAEIFKFFVLSVHYRSVLDFSPSYLNQSLLSLARIYSSLAFAEKKIAFAKEHFHLTEKDLLAKFNKGGDLRFQLEKKSRAMDFLNFLKEKDLEIKKFFCDDFNTPQIMAALFEGIRFYNLILRSPESKKKLENTFSQFYISLNLVQWIQSWGKILSLFQEPAQEFLICMDDLILKKRNLDRSEIQKKIDQRTKARKEKNYALADQLRNQLGEKKILLQDLVNGETEWEVQKNPEPSPESSKL